MTYNDLILLIPQPDSPTDVVGKAFFSSSVSAADKKRFINYLLDNKRFYQLSDVMTSCTLTQTYSGDDFIKQKSLDANSMDSRYFDMLLLLCGELNIDEKELIPMIFVTATAKNGTLLRGWFAAAKTYLLRIAYNDYELAFDYILKYDIKFNFLDVLVKVDRPKTVSILVGMVISGKNINKTELRMFLRSFKDEVLKEIKGKYLSLKLLERESAVRLLMLFKNDNIVSNYLLEIEKVEKSIIIQRLIQTDLTLAEDNFEASGAVDYFYNCMVSGADFSLDSFCSALQNEENERVASGLFFSVYSYDLFSMIVIVENGKICDLSNNPINLPSDVVIRVMHPCEITNKYVYLKNLTIIQPFEQLNRKVYSVEDNKADNIYKNVKGTLITDRDLKSNMKIFGFKGLNKNSDGLTSEVGIVRDGIMCALSICPTNLSRLTNKLVSAESVKFYSMQDVIKVNGQIYVSDVPLYPISALSPRSFSEFLYSVYELLGCI